MARILVVDDSADQARMVAALLEVAEHKTEIAENGAKAVELVERRAPDMVVTDLVMPEMDGLDLVEAVNKIHPSLPIVLMTAYGSGEIAMKALRRGAASYVPKRILDQELVETVERLLDIAWSKRERERMLSSLVESESRFTLATDPSLVPALVNYIQEMVAGREQGIDETVLMQVGLALQEAMFNAIHHGNLGLGSEIRETSSQEFHAQIKARLSEPAYCDRRVHVRSTVSASQLEVVIRDEGRGFDLSSVPDPTDPENLLRASGRGLYLIGTFMDQVVHNDTGNEITMRRKLSPAGSRK